MPRIDIPKRSMPIIDLEEVISREESAKKFGQGEINKIGPPILDFNRLNIINYHQNLESIEEARSPKEFTNPNANAASNH